MSAIIGIDVGGTNTDAVRLSGERIVASAILRVDETVVLTVPDLITLVETETGTPITTEVIRPGLRVSIIGLASTPLYHRAEALRVGGPSAFGYEMPFVALARA